MKIAPRFCLLAAFLMALVLRLAADGTFDPHHPSLSSSPAARTRINRAEAQPTLASPAVLEDLSRRANQELRENILPFWLKNARNTERGGFHSFIGQDMKVRDTLPRGALLTSRILWTFSAAYRHYHDPTYLEMARWAYRDLADNFIDREHGGLFWSITPAGQPAGVHKQIYGQVFGIYALTEYYRVTNEQPALDQAIAIYRLIDAHARDAQNGGYAEVLNREWQHEPGPKNNPLGNAPKSQNSHIHILEGFTNLLRVWPDAGLRERQHELIELTLRRIIDPRTHHLVLFMQNDWTPIGDDISYGHDIELSWLLVEAAEVLGDPALLVRAKQAALDIARVTQAEGIDRDGGVFNEGNPHGLTDTNKDWWPQAEAAVGFLNAYEISHDPAYFAASVRSWDFIEAKFVDRKNGDWFEALARDGTPQLEIRATNGTVSPHAKLSLWKCPYHNGRSCLELIERTHRLTAAALGKP